MSHYATPTAQHMPPMSTEADILAWEAAPQSAAGTEALTIVHDIETNPAIGIPTPHPLQATDSDVYAMDLVIEQVMSEHITTPHKRTKNDDGPTPAYHCTVPDERRKKKSRFAIEQSVTTRKCTSPPSRNTG